MGVDAPNDAGSGSMNNQEKIEAIRHRIIGNYVSVRDVPEGQNYVVWYTCEGRSHGTGHIYSYAPGQYNSKAAAKRQAITAGKRLAENWSYSFVTPHD